MISFILLGSMLLQDLVWADPSGEIYKARSSDSGVRSIDIPEMAGSIEDVFRAASGDQTLYLIQDAHVNESAQRSVASILEHLIRRESIRTVFLEAGTGDDSLSDLRSLAPERTRREVSDPFLRKGHIQGPDHLSLTSDLAFKLWGVEDKTLYYQGIELYRALVRDRDDANAFLDRIRRALKTLKPRTFHPDLLAFDEARAGYLSGKLGLTDYFDALSDAADTHGISLLGHPHILMLKEVRRMEMAIDFDKANVEQAKALLAMTPEDRGLLTTRLAERKGLSKLGADGGRRLADLYAMFEEKLEDRKSEFGEFKKYCDYLAAAQRIGHEDLLDEIAFIENAVYAALARTEDEATLCRITRAEEILRRVVDLQASYEDIQRMHREPDAHDAIEIAGRLNARFMDLEGSYEDTIFLDAAFERALGNALKFYELTRERDAVFVERITQKMRSDRESKAAFVVGGFHAQELKRMLRERNVSFVSILPRILAETDLKRYESILLSQVLPNHTGEPLMAVRSASKMWNTLPANEATVMVGGARLSVRQMLSNELGALRLPAAAAGARLAVSNWKESAPGLRTYRFMTETTELRAGEDGWTWTMEGGYRLEWDRRAGMLTYQTASQAFRLPLAGVEDPLLDVQIKKPFLFITQATITFVLDEQALTALTNAAGEDLLRGFSPKQNLDYRITGARLAQSFHKNALEKLLLTRNPFREDGYWTVYDLARKMGVQTIDIYSKIFGLEGRYLERLITDAHRPGAGEMERRSDLIIRKAMQTNPLRADGLWTKKQLATAVGLDYFQVNYILKKNVFLRDRIVSAAVQPSRGMRVVSSDPLEPWIRIYQKIQNNEELIDGSEVEDWIRSLWKRLFIVAWSRFHLLAAEDVVQETFLHAAGSLSQFDGRGAFDAWLHRVLIRTGYQMLRKERPVLSREAADLGDAPETDLISHEDSPETIMQHQEFEASVDQLISGVPRNYQDILRFRLKEYLSNEEIAERLGLTVGIVKNRMFDARKAFIRQLALVRSDLPMGLALAQRVLGERSAGARLAGQVPTLPNFTLAVSVPDIAAEVIDSKVVAHEKALSRIERLVPDLSKTGAGKLYVYGIFRPSELSKLVHQNDLPDLQIHPALSVREVNGQRARFIRSGQAMVMVQNYRTKDQKVDDIVLRDGFGNLFSIYGMDKLRESQEDLASLARTAHEHGLRLVVDFIPWLSPDAIDETNYRWARSRRELTDAQNERFRSLTSDTERQTWLEDLLLTHPGYAAVRITEGGRERVVLLRHNYYGMNIDQIELDPSLIEVQDYWIRSLSALSDLGADEFRVDLASHLILNVNEGEPMWRVKEAVQRHAQRTGKTIAFFTEGYEERDRHLLVGADHVYSDAFFRRLYENGHRPAAEQIKGPIFEALLHNKPYVYYPSNYDQLSVAAMGYSPEAISSLMVLLSAMGGARVMIDLRDWIGHEGHLVPVPGGNGGRLDRNAHLFARPDEIHSRMSFEDLKELIQRSDLVDLLEGPVSELVRDPQEWVYWLSSDRPDVFGLGWRSREGLYHVAAFRLVSGSSEVDAVLRLPDDQSGDLRQAFGRTAFKVSFPEGRGFVWVSSGARLAEEKPNYRTLAYLLTGSALAGTLFWGYVLTEVLPDILRRGDPAPASETVMDERSPEERISQSRAAVKEALLAMERSLDLVRDVSSTQDGQTDRALFYGILAEKAGSSFMDQVFAAELETDLVRDLARLGGRFRALSARPDLAPALDLPGLSREILDLAERIPSGSRLAQSQRYMVNVNGEEKTVPAIDDHSIKYILEALEIEPQEVEELRVLDRRVAGRTLLVANASRVDTFLGIPINPEWERLVIRTSNGARLSEPDWNIYSPRLQLRTALEDVSSMVILAMEDQLGGTAVSLPLMLTAVARTFGQTVSVLVATRYPVLLEDTRYTQAIPQNISRIEFNEARSVAWDALINLHTVVGYIAGERQRGNMLDKVAAHYQRLGLRGIPDDRVLLNRTRSDKPYVYINPHTVSYAYNFPLYREYLMRVMSHLMSMGVSVMLNPGRPGRERLRSEGLAEEVTGGDAESVLAPDAGLAGFIDDIGGAAAVLSADSAAAHIAQLFGVPTWVIPFRNTWRWLDNKPGRVRLITDRSALDTTQEIAESVKGARLAAPLAEDIAVFRAFWDKRWAYGELEPSPGGYVQHPWRSRYTENPVKIRRPSVLPRSLSGKKEYVDVFEEYAVRRLVGQGTDVVLGSKDHDSCISYSVKGTDASGRPWVAQGHYLQYRTFYSERSYRALAALIAHVTGKWSGVQVALSVQRGDHELPSPDLMRKWIGGQTRSVTVFTRPGKVSAFTSEGGIALLDQNRSLLRETVERKWEDLVHGTEALWSVPLSEAYTRLIRRYEKPQTLSWVHKDHTLDAQIRYDEDFDVFIVVPGQATFDRYPALKILFEPASQEEIGPSGSFGRIRLRLADVKGSAAAIFDEIQPSLGYRRLRDYRLRDAARFWVEHTVEVLSRDLSSFGVAEFYASTSERIDRRYRERLKIQIPEINLWENYRFPFKGKGWERAAVDLPGDPAADLWKAAAGARLAEEIPLRGSGVRRPAFETIEEITGALSVWTGVEDPVIQYDLESYLGRVGSERWSKNWPYLRTAGLGEARSLQDLTRRIHTARIAASLRQLLLGYVVSAVREKVRNNEDEDDLIEAVSILEMAGTRAAVEEIGKIVERTESVIVRASAVNVLGPFMLSHPEMARAILWKIATSDILEDSLRMKRDEADLMDDPEANIRSFAQDTLLYADEMALQESLPSREVLTEILEALDERRDEGVRVDVFYRPDDGLDRSPKQAQNVLFLGYDPQRETVAVQTGTFTIQFHLDATGTDPGRLILERIRMSTGGSDASGARLAGSHEDWEYEYLAQALVEEGMEPAAITGDVLREVRGLVDLSDQKSPMAPRRKRLNEIIGNEKDATPQRLLRVAASLNGQNKYRYLIRRRFGSSLAADHLIHMMDRYRIRVVERPGGFKMDNFTDYDTEKFPKTVRKVELYVDPITPENEERFFEANRRAPTYGRAQIIVLQEMSVISSLADWLLVRRAKSYRLSEDLLFDLRVGAVGKMADLFMRDPSGKIAGEKIFETLDPRTPFAKEIITYFTLLGHTPPRAGRGESFLEDYGNVIQGLVQRAGQISTPVKAHRELLDEADADFFEYVTDSVLERVATSQDLGRDAILRDEVLDPSGRIQFEYIQPDSEQASVTEIARTHSLLVAAMRRWLPNEPLPNGREVRRFIGFERQMALLDEHIEVTKGDISMSEAAREALSDYSESDFQRMLQWHLLAAAVQADPDILKRSGFQFLHGIRSIDPAENGWRLVQDDTDAVMVILSDPPAYLKNGAYRFEKVRSLTYLPDAKERSKDAVYLIAGNQPFMLLADGAIFTVQKKEDLKNGKVRWYLRSTNQVNRVAEMDFDKHDQPGVSGARLALSVEEHRRFHALSALYADVPGIDRLRDRARMSDDPRSILFELEAVYELEKRFGWQVIRFGHEAFDKDGRALAELDAVFLKPDQTAAIMEAKFFARAKSWPDKARHSLMQSFQALRRILENDVLPKEWSRSMKKGEVSEVAIVLSLDRAEEASNTGTARSIRRHYQNLSDRFQNKTKDQAIGPVTSTLVLIDPSRVVLPEIPAIRQKAQSAARVFRTLRLLVDEYELSDAERMIVRPYILDQGRAVDVVGALNAQGRSREEIARILRRADTFVRPAAKGRPLSVSEIQQELRESIRVKVGVLRKLERSGARKDRIDEVYARIHELKEQIRKSSGARLSSAAEDVSRPTFGDVIAVKNGPRKSALKESDAVGVFVSDAQEALIEHHQNYGTAYVTVQGGRVYKGSVTRVDQKTGKVHFDFVDGLNRPNLLKGTRTTDTVTFGKWKHRTPPTAEFARAKASSEYLGAAKPTFSKAIHDERLIPDLTIARDQDTYAYHFFRRDRLERWKLYLAESGNDRSELISLLGLIDRVESEKDLRMIIRLHPQIDREIAEAALILQGSEIKINSGSLARVAGITRSYASIRLKQNASLRKIVRDAIRRTVRSQRERVTGEELSGLSMVERWIRLRSASGWTVSSLTKALNKRGVPISISTISEMERHPDAPFRNRHFFPEAARIMGYPASLLLFARADEKAYLAELTVGDRLKAARLLKGLSQRDFADKVGVSQTSVQAWEERGVLPESTRRSLAAQILGYPEEFLFRIYSPDAAQGARLADRDMLRDLIRNSPGLIADLERAARLLDVPVDMVDPLRTAEKVHYALVSSDADFLSQAFSYEAVFRYAPDLLIDHLNRVDATETPGARLADASWLPKFKFMLVGIAAVFSLTSAQAMPIQLNAGEKSEVFTIQREGQDVVARSSHIGDVRVDRRQKVSTGARLSMQDALTQWKDRADAISASLDETQISTAQRLILEIDAQTVRNASEAHVRLFMADLERFKKHRDGENVVLMLHGEALPGMDDVFSKTIPAGFEEAKRVRLGLPENLEAGYANVPMAPLGHNDYTDFFVLSRLAVQEARLSDPTKVPDTLLSAHSTLANAKISLKDLALSLSGKKAALDVFNRLLIRPMLEDLILGARLAQLRERMIEQSA